MQRKPEQEFWFLRPADPEFEASFRRWNRFVIPLLLFLVIGVFVAGWCSELRANSGASQFSPPAHSASHGHN